MSEAEQALLSAMAAYLERHYQTSEQDHNEGDELIECRFIYEKERLTTARANARALEGGKYVGD